MSSNASLLAPKAAPATRQVRLVGVTPTLDRRVNAFRSDLADIALAGRIIAPRYAGAVAMQCRQPVAEVHDSASASATCISELLFGERFDVFDRAAGWAWGQRAGDRYVGWVQEMALSPCGAPATHTITAPQALLFAAPSIKAPVTATLALGSAVVAADYDATFLSVGEAFLHRRHVAPVTGDAVDLALAFVGSPYRWGGRTRAGLDCSGLVQTVLSAHGVACPRDSDQQLSAFPGVAFEERRRGDLVAFPGHIGLLVDADHLLHANAFHMTTLAEPLAVVTARLIPLHANPVLGVVRPPCGVPGASL